MIEVYKYLNGLSPDIMSDIFKLRENTYSLRNFNIFDSQNPRTKRLGLASIAYRASQLWKNIPEEIRNSTSLSMFKKKIKKVSLISCSCNCCRKYIHHVGFIQLFYIFNGINLSTSCSPELRINLALYIQLCNRDQYSAKSGLHFGQYEALVDFYSSLLLYYLFDRV